MKPLELLMRLQRSAGMQITERFPLRSAEVPISFEQRGFVDVRVPSSFEQTGFLDAGIF